MHNSYTFFIISSINSPHSAFTPDQRFIQTLETIESIRSKVPNSNLIFYDNSTNPITEDQIRILRNSVDHYIEPDVNMFVEWVNSTGKNKGLNELLAYQKMLAECVKHRLVGRRIFKISGRYKLADTFDIYEYEKPQYYGRYVFRVTPWVYNEGAGQFVKHFYNTALWSLCYTLVDEYAATMKQIFKYMMISGENIEMGHNHLIPKDRLVLVDRVHGNGYITNGEWTHF